MASSLGPSQPWSIGSIVLLIIAAGLYALLLVPLLDAAGSQPPIGGEDRYSAAWSELFALGFGALLWLDLGFLLWTGAARIEASGLVLAGLYLLAGLAGGFAIDQVFKAPGGWLVLVPMLLPPLVALLALWGRSPTLMLGAIALVGLAAIPLAALDGQRGPSPEREALNEAYREQLRQEKEAEFAALTADSLLEDYLDLINSGVLGEAGTARALAAARQVKNRQSDAVMLLDASKTDRLENLWRFDLAATPELCSAYGYALQRYAAREIRLDYTVMALERQLPNIRWLMSQGCDLDASLAAVGTILQSAKGGGSSVKPFLATLAELRVSSVHK